MNKCFQYIFSKSSVFLFYTGLALAIILTSSFFYLTINHPMLLINSEGPSEFDFFKSTTLLGKFYMISGIFPNFLFFIIFNELNFKIESFFSLLYL